MPYQRLFHFTHSSPEITTLADLLANANSPAFLYFKEPERFLKIIGEDGLTNRQRIETTYTLPDDPKKGTSFSRMTLKVGTIFYLEADKVNQPSFLTEGIQVVSNDEPAFKAEKLAELEADKGYYQIDKPIHGQLSAGTSQQSYPDVSVWIWCRALSGREDEDYELKGQFFNLSPFIEKIVTNSSKNGGNFQIKLPPLVCELDEHNKWSITKGTLTQYTTDKFTSIQGDGYVAQSSLFHSETFQENPNKASDDVLARNQFFFHNVIGSNDLVFIRFETLDMEKEQRYEDAQEFIISKNNIANRIYDMIGLVDSNTQTVNPANNDVSINISGRDLSKLFIEDGTYFYALENSQGMLKFAGQSTIKDSQLSRIFADNGMSFIGLYLFQSIEYILKFIIQQLSNIKVVPDELFTSYEKSKKKVNGVEQEYDGRSKQFRRDGYSGINNKKREELKGKALDKIDALRSSSGNRSFISAIEDEKQKEIFNSMVNFLQTIRKENKREVNEYSKIGGWKSFVYNGESIDDNTFPEYFSKNLLDYKGNIDTNLYSFLNICDNYIDAGIPQKEYKEQLSAGIWQIVDLVIDSTVANRKLADSSFSTANGSLLNFIRSACQEPLVEFYMDTYGDKYHLIVRRPPYDQKGLISLIEGKVNTQSGTPITPPAIVDVDAADVLMESLSFDDSQVYSWYHFFPRNSLIGSAEEYSLSYLGALYFEEYAEIYGSKPFQQSNSYLPYQPINNKNNSGLGIDELQAIEDLKFVVESHQYLPFTRKGTLTLNRDRRLKIGNILRYKSTGEIFFIEGVQHSFSISESSIDAVTTVQVSRGMIEQFIYGKYLTNEKGQPRFVSYFNCIDTRLTFNKKMVDKTITTRVKKKNIPEINVTKNLVTQSSFIVDNFLQNLSVIETGENKGIGFLESYNQHPANKNRFTAFINAINNAGYWAIISPLAANRTYAQQAALKRANQNNADPGHSRHEKGAAIDITIVNKRTGKVHSKSTDKAEWISTGIPAIAKDLGLRWAGGDGSFGSYVDRVHFEIATITEQLSAAQVEADEWEYKTETVKQLMIMRENLFSKFKTNKFTFDFFQKRLQMSPEHRNVTSRNVYDSGGVLLNEVILHSKKS